MIWPTKKLGDNDVKILVLTKAIFMRGCDFAQNKDEVGRMLAIHTFDNTVEMTLKLIAKIRGAISPQKDNWEFFIRIFKENIS